MTEGKLIDVDLFIFDIKDVVICDVKQALSRKPNGQK